MSDLLKSILGENGSLKKAYPAFTPREAQLIMSEAVEKAIETHSTLIVEAGTGVGKTFAYLIPALLSDKKTLISTGTKTLQDQLFQQDLPTLRQWLAINKKIVLLKGRSNYLCLYRLSAPQQEDLLENQSLSTQLSRIQHWSKITKSGDLAELTDFSEDSLIFQHMTSSSESCLGHDCEFYDACFVVKARREALAADVVVVNHHLFFADLSLKEESLGKLLPDMETIIFDEAHQLYEAASSFLSERFSSRDILLLIRDLQLEYKLLGTDHPDILRLIFLLKQEISHFRLSLGENGRRDAWFEAVKAKRVSMSLSKLIAFISELSLCLSEQAQRSQGLDMAWRRAQAFHLFLQKMSQKNHEANLSNDVFWFETFSMGFVIYKTPIDFSTSLSSAMNDAKKAWIYTSASLDAGFGLDHFTHPLGIIPQEIVLLKSPYHYSEQARLYFPRYLPQVKEENFIASWVEALIPLCEAANGRTFLLFTSHKAMQEAYELLGDRDFVLLMQGKGTKYALLEQFKSTERCILLGTNSFWQGVDVQGAALSCVCIDKLPFASPADPVTKARINAYKKAGRDAFYEYQLPAAVIMLKQGVGRLIRSEYDKGILMIGDMRLLTKEYGAIFLKAMPEAKIVRDEEKAVDFLKSIF